mmetsp:Transcript_2201/g.5447  ORF Transcript_2201/g.5447 Transcript_2201/m.5447 type:complete len:256 (-) Transcript_2201:64-831(-)
MLFSCNVIPPLHLILNSMTSSVVPLSMTSKLSASRRFFVSSFTRLFTIPPQKSGSWRPNATSQLCLAFSNGMSGSSSVAARKAVSFNFRASKRARIISSGLFARFPRRIAATAFAFAMPCSRTKASALGSLGRSILERGLLDASLLPVASDSESFFCSKLLKPSLRFGGTADFFAGAAKAATLWPRRSPGASPAAAKNVACNSATAAPIPSIMAQGRNGRRHLIKGPCRWDTAQPAPWWRAGCAIPMGHPRGKFH